MQRAIADELKLPLRGREDLVDAEILHDHLRVDHLLDLDLERSVSTRRREEERDTKEKKRWREDSVRDLHWRVAGFGRFEGLILFGWLESRWAIASIWNQRKAGKSNTSTSEIGMETSI